MPLDLNALKILEAVKWHTEQAVNFDSIEKAHKIVLKLSKLLAETRVERPDAEFEYQSALMRAKFIALPVLRDGDVIELMQSNFVQIFELPDYDLWGKLKIKLISIPQFEDRDVLKKKIREALLQNDQAITKESLILDTKSVKGTVRNWLMDYHRSVGTGKIEAIQLSQYLINGANTKSLSQESREKLDFLLKFYEKLKLSSIDLEGVEETMIFNVEGELDIYEEGRVERIGHDAKELLKKLEGLEIAEEVKGELEVKYRGSEEEIKKVEAEKKKLFKTTNGDFKKLSDLLFKVIKPMPGKASNKIQVEAILKILAEAGKLEELLEEKKFNEIMVVYFKEKGRPEQLEGFKVNPRAPEYMAAFLKHILIDCVGMSEDESGRLGMQLFNTLAKKNFDSKYQGLIYFDLENREFKWQ